MFHYNGLTINSDVIKDLMRSPQQFFEDLVVQGQGLNVQGQGPKIEGQGQGIVNWFLGTTTTLGFRHVCL